MRVKEDRCFRCASAELPAVVSRAKQAVLCAALFLPAILGWGCAGVVSGHSTSPTSTPPPTYTISGTITPAAGGSGTTITLSGAASATTTASSSGSYTFTGLVNGTDRKSTRLNSSH